MADRELINYQQGSLLVRKECDCNDFLCSLICDTDRALVLELMTINSPLDTKHLQEACGLSRSATLNRLKRLVERGFVKSIESRFGNSKPYYKFMLGLACNKLSTEVKPEAQTPSFCARLEKELIAMATEIVAIRDRVDRLETKI